VLRALGAGHRRARWQRASARATTAQRQAVGGSANASRDHSVAVADGLRCGECPRRLLHVRFSCRNRRISVRGGRLGSGKRGAPPLIRPNAVTAVSPPPPPPPTHNPLPNSKLSPPPNRTIFPHPSYPALPFPPSIPPPPPPPPPPTLSHTSCCSYPSLITPPPLTAHPPPPPPSHPTPPVRR
jgi:hypothetical protein